MLLDGSLTLLQVDCMVLRPQHPWFPHLVPAAPLIEPPGISLLVLGVCRMEETQLVADRAHLRKLLRTPPTWPYQEYADQIGRSYDWVKQWAKRLLAASPDDEAVLWSRSS